MTPASQKALDMSSRVDEETSLCVSEACAWLRARREFTRTEFFSAHQDWSGEWCVRILDILVERGWVRHDDHRRFIVHGPV